MHPFPFDKHVENMTKERKARNTSVRLGQRGLGFKLLQRTQGTTFLFIYLFMYLFFSSPVWGKLKKIRYMYCTVKLTEAVKQAPVNARERSWGRCKWLVCLMRASFGAWGLSEATGYRETKRKEGCALVFARR